VTVRRPGGHAAKDAGACRGGTLTSLSRRRSVDGIPLTLTRGKAV